MDDMEKIIIGGLTLDMFKHTITGPEGTEMLTPTELRLLRFFMEHPGRWLSYPALIWAVWGEAGRWYDSSNVRVHIGHIRKKIGPGHIKSRRHHGYMLEDERGS